MYIVYLLFVLTIYIFFFQGNRFYVGTDTQGSPLAVFKANGRVVRENAELFSEISWVEVLLGQRVAPRSYHPLVDAMPAEKITRFLDNLRSTIQRCVEVMPAHADFVARHCATALRKAMAASAAVR